MSILLLLRDPAFRPALKDGRGPAPSIRGGRTAGIPFFTDPRLTHIGEFSEEPGNS
ncbi:hypothetical protein GCM10027187_58580 [Streptosporangium sandarakinum]